MVHQAGQRAQHTTNELFRPVEVWFNPSEFVLFAERGRQREMERGRGCDIIMVLMTSFTEQFKKVGVVTV